MAQDVVRQADRTCLGVIQEAQYQAREKHTQRAKPQPWIVLKLAVFISVAIIGFTSWVYIGKFCVPMILKHDGALGSQATGIAFLVVFCPLLIMVIWSYVKVVFTPPGHAKDFVPKCAEPNFPSAPPGNSDDTGGTEYEQSNPADHSPRPSHAHTNSISTSHSNGRSPSQRTAEMSQKPVGRGSTTSSSVSTPAAIHKPGRQSSRGIPQLSNNASAGVFDALPLHASSIRDIEDGRGPTSRPQNAADPSPPLYSRSPPTTPILLPEYRFCSKDELIKPFRAHHCRACGTCVLKYDHHCPWVGQCVGARNHKFFVNFVLWAALFCIWIFATLLALIVKEGSNPNGNLDPQEIVAIALAGIFGMFTVALLVSHVHLICLNQTTVESLGFRTMRERENRKLAQMHSWHHFDAKKRTQRQWDYEWGRIGKEGNMWWLGSARENWEAVMGRNVWWWFLPIGHSSSDGKTYPVNPRFDSEGRWRRKAEWPPELR